MNDDPTVLLTPRGAAALARAAALRADHPERGELAVAAELRREFPADLAAAAMAQAELREAASAKFSRAGEMLFTRGGYEQASGELIARHRAARFAGARRIADLCCGIGGDLIALAALSVREILAVDRDPAHTRLALCNAGAYGADHVRACVADVRDVPLKSFDAVFIDPARRADTRGGGTTAGRFRAGVSEPPLDWCAGLTEQVPAVCVKAAPGLPAELIPPGWEAEFIADGRDLKEAVLWSPAFATVRSVHGEREGAPRRATILPGGHTLTAVPGDPVPVAEPGEYLLDPSPAITRAGLVEDLARMLGGWKIDQQIAFISTNHPATTPFARTLRVLYEAPWNEKRFAARLRELGVGAADLRRRGLAGDVDQIRRRLKLDGPHRATVVLTRHAGGPWGLICADAPAGETTGT
jgi:predicted O-methyltransferase YrrM